jgi:hypothetical protein
MMARHHRDMADRGAASQLDEVPLLRQIKTPVVVLANELVHLFRVNIVVVYRLPILVAGDIYHFLIFRVREITATSHSSEDACPLPMRQLTPLVFTDPRVAEVRALERVAIRTAGAFVAVSVKAEIAAYWSCWWNFHVSILAVRLGATIPGKMQTGRGAFGGRVMREIAILAVEAVTLL